MSDATRRLSAGSPPGVLVPRFGLEVIAGPDAGKLMRAVDGRITVGTAPGATLQLDDPAVSRFHLELAATERGLILRDLGSTNGTHVGKLAVLEAIVEDSVQIELGGTRLQLRLEPARAAIALSTADRFGGLLGSSLAMREVYAALERAAPTSAPVLLLGESGTGKEVAARSIHSASPRSSEPFEVVDCGGLPAALIESELFGHERGAFTGASEEHDGAFARADGGTLFLDELGELPLELQPKLLRALGEREIRRLGGKHIQKVDVRVVAATNRDLRREVNAGRFRADLYYRLAVIEVRMPPLRERLTDLPAISARLLEQIALDRGVDTEDLALPAELWQHDWPGNVRELRNYLEQLAILRRAPKLSRSEPEPAADGELTSGLGDLPLVTAKNELVARFERRYLEQLLERTGGNVAEAARRSGVNRATLFRQIRRYGLRGVH